MNRSKSNRNSADRKIQHAVLTHNLRQCCDFFKFNDRWSLNAIIIIMVVVIAICMSYCCLLLWLLSPRSHYGHRSQSTKNHSDSCALESAIRSCRRTSTLLKFTRPSWNFILVSTFVFLLVFHLHLV